MPLLPPTVTIIIAHLIVIVVITAHVRIVSINNQLESPIIQLPLRQPALRQHRLRSLLAAVILA